MGIALFSFHGRECETAEWQDGIGGEMVLARKKQAGAGKAKGAGGRKNEVSRGTAKLKAAADKTLEEHSAEIAESLLHELMGGNNMSAKLLFALAEGQIDFEDEAAVHQLCRLAERLSSEPEWEGGEMDAEAEREIKEVLNKGKESDPGRLG